MRYISSMHCESCNSIIDGSYGSGRFCSKSCSSAFSTKNKRLQINSVVSKKMTGRTGWAKGRKQSKDEIEKRKLGFTAEKRLHAAQKVSETKLKKYADTKFGDLSFGQKKRRVKEEQEFCCNRCKLSSWLDEPIKLEVEHKDGNNKNNCRDNLEALCPNCHSLTPTWRKSRAVKRRLCEELSLGGGTGIRASLRN